MHHQARYDAVLLAIPALFVLGGALTAITSGTQAVLAALGTAIAGASTVGRALFVTPPTDPDQQ